MNLVWRTELSTEARRRLKKLDKSQAKKIVSYLRTIEQLEDPRSRGKALSAQLSGLWRWRVGDYRIIAKIVDQRLIILVLDVEHRSTIYKK